MAKFWLEDGSVKSGDKIIQELMTQKRQGELYDVNRNHDKLNQIALFDLLWKLQEGIINGNCVIKTLSHNEMCECNQDCRSCIMNYLNEKQK